MLAADRWAGRGGSRRQPLTLRRPPGGLSRRAARLRAVRSLNGPRSAVASAGDTCATASSSKLAVHVEDASTEAEVPLPPPQLNHPIERAHRTRTRQLRDQGSSRRSPVPPRAEAATLQRAEVRQRPHRGWRRRPLHRPRTAPESRTGGPTLRSPCPAAIPEPQQQAGRRGADREHGQRRQGESQTQRKQRHSHERAAHRSPCPPRPTTVGQPPSRSGQQPCQLRRLQAERALDVGQPALLGAGHSGPKAPRCRSDVR